MQRERRERERRRWEQQRERERQEELMRREQHSQQRHGPTSGPRRDGASMVAGGVVNDGGDSDMSYEVSQPLAF